MTGQPLDLRRSLHILRRHMAWVGILVAVGLLGGIGYVLMNPPMVTSNVLVAIPTSTRYPSAQLVTARSEPVLAIAGQHLSPALTPKALVGRVQVTGLTPYLLLIGGQGRPSTGPGRGQGDRRQLCCLPEFARQSRHAGASADPGRTD